MHSRRTILAAFAAVTLLMAGPAFAGGSKPYDPVAFDAAVKSGKPVLVEISAPWCPICKTQKPIIGKLLSDPKFKEMAAFELDFDSGKAEVRRLGANAQSTLIVYKDGKEVGRSVGETQPEWIADLLDKAI
ncbi:MAG: thiol reductase thioredoxin [Ancylobacter novellus]|uniref:Thiol reductase thioredoxin n=1 Tax=Ancylobacter novellus TaxID=921 RepID=A0A2W5KBM0_ANCNO|nr:MAG: thiol reductase thioredoxin [Ancylobacter novellus]